MENHSQKKQLAWKKIMFGIPAGMLYFLFVFPGMSFAQEKKIPHILRVSPVISTIELSPGSNTTVNVTVFNITKNPLPISVSIEPFGVGEDDGEILPGSKTPMPSLSEWITPQTPERIIDPQSSIVIPFAVDIPKTVPVGGYYAMAYITPMLPVSQSSVPVVIPKIGILFLGSIGVPLAQGDPQLEILDTGLSSFLYDTSPIDVSIRVKNMSLMHQSVKPRVEVSPIIGEKSRWDLPEHMIFPGKTRRFAGSLCTARKCLGLYKANIRVSAGGGKIVSKETYVVIFPWKITGIIVLGIMIVWFVLFRRKNILRALRVLIRG